MLVGELLATLSLNDAGFQSGIARARSALSGLSGYAAAQGQAVGANFARGIASGISANTGAIQAAARAAASAAASAARSALQIQSPSKVAAAIGAHFGQGLSQGIASMTKAVSGAAGQLAHAATIASNEAAMGQVNHRNDYTRTQSVAAADAAPAAAPTVLLLDGKEVARTLTEHTNQSLGQRAKQLSLGYGG